MPKYLFGLLCLFFSPVSGVCGEIMFEGYYRIEIAAKPAGYIVQRFEFDNKAKTFTLTQFYRVKVGEKILQESLKAKCNDKFNPISYNHTSQDGDKLKAIDATFSGNIMKLKCSPFCRESPDGKKYTDETYKVPEGTFLSSFLIYVMLQKKLPLNQAFKYSAVAEEEGSSYWGKAWLKSKETKGKLVEFQILNMFKDAEYVSKLLAVPDPDPKEKDKYIKAEITFTEAVNQNLTTSLVASPSNATEGQIVPNKILTSLFGGIPLGKVNLVANPVKEN